MSIPFLIQFVSKFFAANITVIGENLQALQLWFIIYLIITGKEDN